MKALRHELVAVAGLAVAGGLALRGLFFLAAPWLWSFARPVASGEITPWARAAMVNRDGAEPYGLLALVVLLWLVLDSGMGVFARLAKKTKAIVGLASLGAFAALAAFVPPTPPMQAVASSPSALLVVAGAILCAVMLERAMRSRGGVPALVAAVLLSLCFVPTTVVSLQDASTILAPALRLAHGVRLRDVYFQYDLLPSLLAVAWTAVGGAPLAFGLVGAASFYALFLALFAVARRMFTRPALAAPLLVCLVIVRFYAIILDASATPQATPLRIDLWVILLALALFKGLRHWTVGFALGAMCFFSRSVGTLYLGAYALALVADVLAARRAAPALERAPLTRALLTLGRDAAPAVVFVALAFSAARLVFGSFGSDAIALYRTLGVGMLRITRSSFYWWLLPLTGTVGWLAFSARVGHDTRRAQGAIFAVALLVASSLYFFGRSHEHNLVNLAAAFLFCAFLAIDLAAASLARDDRALRVVLRAMPWFVLAVCAYHYSGRVVDKLAMQKAVVAGQRALPPAMSGDVAPVVACQEILGAAGDDRVFFFSRNDYWLYEGCGLVPRGHVQPLWLAIREDRLLAELDRLLAEGYKIVAPLQAGDWDGLLGELLPALGNPERIVTPHFHVYRRAGVP